MIERTGPVLALFTLVISRMHKEPNLVLITNIVTRKYLYSIQHTSCNQLCTNILEMRAFSSIIAHIVY